MSGLRRLRAAAPAAVVLVVLIELVACAATDARGRDVEIRLADGRLLFVDRISPQTDRRRLAVSVVSPRIELTRFLSWNKVAGVRVAGRRLSRDEVIRRFGTLTDESEAGRVIRAVSRTALADGGIGRSAEPATPRSLENRGPSALPQPARFRAFEPPGRVAVDVPPCAPVAPCAACARPRSVVIGVREDPLKAYGKAIRTHFPEGVPLLEVPFALELVRQEKWRDVLWSPSLLEPVPAGLLPARPAPAPSQRGEDPNRSPAPFVPPPSSRGRSPRDGRRQPAAPSQPRPAAARRPTADRPWPAVPPAGPRRPEQLRVRARPISTSGRSDWDALELELIGLNRNDVAVPLRGTLQATLWGMRQRIMPVNSNEILFDTPARPGPMVSAALGPAVRLADWTRALEPSRLSRPAVLSDRFDAVAPSGMVTRVLLPLPRPLPDHNAKLAPFGSLHVRLLVPGVGQLEATVAGVQLQQTGPLRGLQTVTTGSRFLPTETTSGRRHRTPVPFLPRPASPLRPFPFVLD